MEWGGGVTRGRWRSGHYQVVGSLRRAAPSGRVVGRRHYASTVARWVERRWGEDERHV